jgi:hypothetical protein
LKSQIDYFKISTYDLRSSKNLQAFG